MVDRDVRKGCVRPMLKIPRHHAGRGHSWTMRAADRDQLLFFGTADTPSQSQTFEIITIFHRSCRVRASKTVTIGPAKFVANCRWGLSRRNY
jgi:hypothetical protein